MDPNEHKEVTDKLDTIIKNQEQMDQRYLPRKPYMDILALPRFIYEHPKASLVVIAGLFEAFMDMNKSGIITMIISLFKP